MNEAVAILIGAGLRLLHWAVISLFGQRHLQTRGKISRRMYQWKLKAAEERSLTHKLTLSALNGIDISTGMRDVHNFRQASVPQKEVASIPKGAVNDYRSGTLNLPPHSCITNGLKMTCLRLRESCASLGGDGSFQERLGEKEAIDG